MKRFKTNMSAFIFLPAIVSVFILLYLLIIYTRSNLIMNVVNIGIDGLILIFYFMNFSYMVRFDEEWIIFYTPLKKYSMKRKELGFVVHSSFLTKFVCKTGKFYIPTTSNGSILLKDMFKEFNKDKDGNGE